MRIANLEPNKYKRFFSFGCSFTNYIWPTWADIIGKDFDFYQNWGDAGAGNHFIFNSIIEADARYNFNENDLVIVMWSFIIREDRYINNRWQHDTIKSLEKTYGSKWFKKYALDKRSFLIRDLAFMKASQTIIQKANWEQFCFNPITNIDKDKVTKQGIDSNSISESDGHKFWIQVFDDLCEGNGIHPLLENLDIIETYKEVFLNINKTFEGRWSYEYTQSRGLINNDVHPTPLEALKFLDIVWPNNTLSDSARRLSNQQISNNETVIRL